MTYISLYRKWRPQTFSQLVGQGHIAGTLANAIKSDRVGHAYLFAGPRGTGKTSTAKILAKSVNCATGVTPEPCGKCQSCLTIAAGTSLDVIEMDAASNRGIEEIRELREKVAFAAAGSKRKVYIIDEVHMLTREAFNALLKTLEEPPVHVIFVLATTDPNKVPATISSRCQHFEFRRIPNLPLTAHLAKIAAAEKIVISEDALKIVARQAEGSLRDAIGILDQLGAYTDEPLGVEETTAFLGLIEATVVEEVVDIIISGSVDKVFVLVESLLEAGRDLRQFSAALLAYLRDLFIILHVGEEENRRRLLGLSDEGLERLNEQSTALGEARLRSAMSAIGDLCSDIRFAADQRLALELALIKLCRSEELTLESLAGRLARLEQGAPIGRGDDFADVPPPAAAPRGPDPKKRPARQAAPSEVEITLELLRQKWPEVLKRAKETRLSLYAFLIEGRPSALGDDGVIIDFPKRSGFAAGELNKTANAKNAREILAQVFGRELGFRAVVVESGAQAEPAAPSVDTAEPPAAETEVAPADAAETSAPPDAEKGAQSNDLIGLLKENFGAEVVEEVDSSGAK